MNRKLYIVKFFSLVFAVSLLSFLGSILIYQTKAQWTGAPGLPPSSNVPAPLNVGSSNQQKVGGLTLGKDIYIDPRVSNSTQSGLRLYPADTVGMYGYLFNNFNTLQYNVQTSIGEERRFTIGNDGNTAIGDIIPQAKLHVDGSIRANGVIQATGKVYSEGNEVLTSLSEQDPKIGTLTNNQWCYTNGSQVICNQNAPQIRVASSCSAGSAINIIYSDGTVSCETDDVGTFTLAAGSVASSHILNGTILTQDLNVSDIETTFQRRTSGNCNGQAVVSINQNGTLNCEADDIGLTSVPADSVGSNEIVNSSITSNDIDVSSVQRRVSGTCAVGESIRAIASDGTVTCETDDVGTMPSPDVSLSYVGSCDAIAVTPCKCNAGETIMLLQAYGFTSTGSSFCRVVNQNSSSVYGERENSNARVCNFACFK